MDGLYNRVGLFKSVGLPKDELLAGLAEECSELAQAALKYRRVLTEVNPTTISGVEALKNLLEEFGDVLLYMSQLNIFPADVMSSMIKKHERWHERMAQHRKEEETDNVKDYSEEHRTEQAD